MPVRIELVYALPEEQFSLRFELAEGARVEDVLRMAGDDLVFARFPLQDLTVGIWGEVVSRDHALADGDRVELYRPLPIDPKEARRRRVKKA